MKRLSFLGIVFPELESTKVEFQAGLIGHIHSSRAAGRHVNGNDLAYVQTHINPLRLSVSPTADRFASPSPSSGPRSSMTFGLKLW